MKGTKFQLKVWNYLKKIPKGEVRTYKQVAIGTTDNNLFFTALSNNS